jgi:hypothetical protein
MKTYFTQCLARKGQYSARPTRKVWKNAKRRNICFCARTHSVEEAILKTHDRKQACATSLMSGESDETSISPREAHRIAQDCKPFSSAPQSA